MNKEEIKYLKHIEEDTNGRKILRMFGRTGHKASCCLK